MSSVYTFVTIALLILFFWPLWGTARGRGFVRSHTKSFVWSGLVIFCVGSVAFVLVRAFFFDEICALVQRSEAAYDAAFFGWMAILAFGLCLILTPLCAYLTPEAPSEPIRFGGAPERSPLEERLFRRVPEGWNFTTPGLWPVGGRWSYLVNEVQKTELLARLTRSRTVSFAILFPGLLAFAFVESDWGLGKHDWAHCAIVAFSVFLIFGVVSPAIELFVLRPVLSGAVRTASAARPIRLNFWSEFLPQAKAWAQSQPLPRLMLWCLFNAGVAFYLWHMVLTSRFNYVFLIGALGSAISTIQLAVVLFLVLRERRSHG
jgi:hypothetical protein